jgi:hypothetical protein
MRYGLFAALLILGMASSGTNARQMPTANVQDMLAKSTVVVVGRIIDTTDDNSAEKAQLRVDRILEGTSVIPGQTIVLTIPQDAGENYRPVGKQQYGIAFLQPTNPGEWIPVDPFNPLIPASPLRKASSDDTGQPLKAVTAELTTALEDLQPTDGSDDADLEAFQTIRILRNLPTELTNQPLHKLAADGHRKLSQTWAITALTCQGDTTFLGAVTPLLTASDSGISKLAVNELTWAIRSLKFADATQASRASKALIPLLAANDIETRRSAASAIGSYPTTETFKPLIKALRDNDRDVRILAAKGLSSARSIQDAPSANLFLKDEGSYLQYWDRWLASHP